MALQRLEFLRESIRNLRSTGSVAPSSRFLCRAIARKIDPVRARVVVELGPGDGVITHYILNRLEANAQLLIFEINEVFVKKLHQAFQHDPRVTIIHDSAEHMGRYFEERGIEAIDYFISGIPFIMLPEALAECITTECLRWLGPRGWFVQFHYIPLMLPFYKRIFGNVDVEVVPLNIPPALIVCCEKRP
ncbi:MAG: SAM-dependent methyltransferase [Bacteroidetes bacterium]|nr:SAM-dependent methyltransferase [Bacteroidota bacterium]